MDKRSTAFPVGLYGMLLFALAWLTLPRLFAPLERFLVGVACVAPRAFASWVATPVYAADSRELDRGERLAHELWQRLSAHELQRGSARLSPADEPVLCRVLQVERVGGGGEPCELRLDRTHHELAGCRDHVTSGGALVGFLAPPGSRAAAADDEHAQALVVLPNHRFAPRIAAALEHDQRRPLQVVLRAAANVDPSPLTVDLWDDPYAATRLGDGRHTVRTRTPLVGTQRLPAGLLVGTSRTWGYERPGAEPLTIGVFVVPPFEPRALSHVVAWRKPGGAGDAPRLVAEARLPRRGAVLHELPGAVHGRHLLLDAGTVADGAAVLHEQRFVGTARGLAFGTALVTSFSASRQRWSLLLLPDDPALPPLELWGQVVGAENGRAVIELLGRSVDPDRRLPSGQMFTGSNGRACPPGLGIGRAVPHPYARDRLVVDCVSPIGPCHVEVLVDEEAR